MRRRIFKLSVIRIIRCDQWNIEFFRKTNQNRLNFCPLSLCGMIWLKNNNLPKPLSIALKNFSLFASDPPPARCWTKVLPRIPPVRRMMPFHIFPKVPNQSAEHGTFPKVRLPSQCEECCDSPLHFSCSTSWLHFASMGSLSRRLLGAGNTLHIQNGFIPAYLQAPENSACCVHIPRISHCQKQFVYDPPPIWQFHLAFPTLKARNSENVREDEQMWRRHIEKKDDNGFPFFRVFTKRKRENLKNQSQYFTIWGDVFPHEPTSYSCRFGWK